MRRAIVVAALVIVAGCTSTPDTSPTITADRASDGQTPTAVADSVPAPTWEPVGDGVEATYVIVPADYSDTEAGTMAIRVVRRLATGARIGSLLVNPGGPGFGGSELALAADAYFDEMLLERFDIVAFDPRGTGDSVPAIDCIDDYDASLLLDPTPGTDEALEALEADAQDFARSCREDLGERLMLFTTNNTARDMDTIRRFLGEDTVSYFGMSYGSELGAVWATLFPETVRAAVLDGAADPTADDQESIRQQMRGFHASVEAFLSSCSVAPGCLFPAEGDPVTEFLAIRDRIDREPLPSLPGRPPANYAVWQTAVVFAMYSDELWPVLDQALADARHGDGGLLLRLHDAYYQRREDGTWGNELEAFTVINCADTTNREGRSAATALRDELAVTAPLLFPADVDPGYGCSFMTNALDPRIAPTGIGAGPIVVVGTTGDPATPLTSTVAMAEALEDGVLLVVEGARHGGYGMDSCIDEQIHRYLIDLVVPATDGC